MNRNDVLPFLSILRENANSRLIEKYDPSANKIAEEEFRQARNEIRLMDEVELFFGLFPIAVQSVFNTPAGYATVLLYELNPPCQITCQEAIEALLSEWDVSLEELPWYLVKQFGKTNMKEAIKQIRANPLTNNAKILLGTVEYWMNLAKDEV